MAAFAKPTGTQPSPASILFPANQKISELLAGEDLDSADPGYIKSDGKVWKSTGAAANAAAKVDGWVPTPAKAGAAVTLVHGVVWGWTNTATPGTELFLGATAGAVADAASTGGTAPIGYVIDNNRVFLDRSYY